MRSATAAIVAASTMALAAWLGAADSTPAPLPPETISSPRPTPKTAEHSPESAASIARRYLGVSSCASAACHGGPNSDPSAKWRSSYTVWATLDKHSRAFSVLFEPRSKRIVQLLDHLPSVDQAKPYQDGRCLACHSAGQSFQSTATSILADGVGCELCHGPAQNWLKRHTERAWLDSRAASAAFKALPDMTDTRDLLSRATACAKCHVGSREPGETIRDVNHDLIAAGHPRLNFEFHAYLGVMPKHWTDEPGKKPNYKTDREKQAAAWAIGQAVSAEAALNLVAARAAADKPLTDPAGRKLPIARHPEFSEYDCYACHHELSSQFPSNRQALARMNPGHRAPGSLPRNAWYFTSPRLLSDTRPALVPNDQRAELLTKLIDGTWSPDNPSVADQNAAELAASMHRLAEAAANASWDESMIDRLLAGATDASTLAPNWDSAAQRFLALEALLAARRELHAPAGQPASGDELEIDRALGEVRKLLEFRIGGSVGSGEPVKRAPDQAAPRVDSPRGYDPLAMQQAFARVFAAVGKTLRVEEGK
jgi:Cytochrome c554 and c-prime